MSAHQEDYFAPTVSEHDLDPGGNYVSAATDSDGLGGLGPLGSGMIE